MTNDPGRSTEEPLDFIDEAFMLIADNVLKHEIQRDGFHFDDECWLEDYAKARALILNSLEVKLREAEADAIRLFRNRVNARAETEIERTGIIEGAHHRAIEAEWVAHNTIKESENA